MITMEMMNTQAGDNEFIIEDDNPEMRQEFGQMVDKLIKRGTSVFLKQGDNYRRVAGYNAATNEWLAPSPISKTEDKKIKGKLARVVDRIKAAGTHAAAVAPTAGG